MSQPKIPTAKFGATGFPVTRLGYGSMGLRGPRTWGVRVVNEADAEIFLHAVLDAGINFIDTAPDYGISEERIGRYLSGRRDEYFLATKCGCDYRQHEDHLEVLHTWTADVIQRNLEASLKRLRTDHIDLLQFHGGNARQLMEAGLIDLLVRFRDQGFIKHLGVSSSLPELKDHLALGVFETYQIPYSCLAPQHHDLIAQAAESGAGVIVRGGVAQGGPDAEIQRPKLNEVWQKARLDEVLPEGMSRAQFILRYTLTHPGVHTVIVGTCNPSHLQENVRAVCDGPLSQDLADTIRTRVANALNA